MKTQNTNSQLACLIRLIITGQAARKEKEEKKEQRESKDQGNKTTSANIEMGYQRDLLMQPNEEWPL